MTDEHNSKHKNILIIISGVILLGGVIYLAGFSKNSNNDDFDWLGWKDFTDGNTGASFKYPENLPTQYISLVDWPPVVNLIDSLLDCMEAGSEIERAGKTEKKIINGRDYCVTTISEGAAGSIYTLYAYAFLKENKTSIFTFSLRSVQCGNYDEPQRIECENERQSFDISQTIDRMAQSLILK